MAIIQSILDTDLYKFTTSYAYCKLFPHAYGEFEFADRDNTIYPPGFDHLVRQELDAMEQLALTPDEEAFLRSEVPYLPPFYVDFLKGFRFNPAEVEVSLSSEGKLSIRSSGLLYRITFWETPILAIVSELYFKTTGQEADMAHVEQATKTKAAQLQTGGITFSLFGMRRRYSFAVENEVTALLKQHAPTSLFGTSNVYLAFRHGLKVSGTHPHEWVQFHAAMFGYKMANYMSMENWIGVYDGDLGTVLTDTYTTDVFFSNFSKKHALLFTSLRHDSGDPLTFTDKAIARYEQLRVNPATKYIVFSDSLNVERVLEIAAYCCGRIGATFGIGTNLSCDVGNGIKPRNIVMKLRRCKMKATDPWTPCVKLSDVSGKHTGEEGEITLAQQTLLAMDEAD